MEGPTEECVPKSSPKSDDGESEEPEEDPEADPEEDSEEEPTENLEAEPEPLNHTSLSQSYHNNDDSEQVIEDPDEDPSEEYVSEASSESDTTETDHQSDAGHRDSNEKKRSLDVAAIEPASLQVSQSQKKCRQDEACKPESAVGSTVTDVRCQSLVSESACDDECASEQKEHAGSSGKRRRSRWEPRCEQVGEASEGDKTSKRRKTRWTNDDAQLKMLGPIQLPDFMEDFVGSGSDPEIQELNVKLLEINRKLQRSELHFGRPEGERSPSPEPVYNNLGIRINTREVRLREKLIQERQLVISKLIEKSPSFKTPPDYKPPKLFKKLYIPVKEYPSYNFIGLIIGPRGNTIKRMQMETGAKILLRGKGADKTSHQHYDPSCEEDLHVCIEADNQESLDAAVPMVEKLLIPIDEGMNDHKRAQLKELAKLNGNFRDENVCSVCKEQGHKHYACPRQQSTFKTANACATCGSFCHPTSNCPSTVSPQISNSLSGSSGLGIGSTPSTKSKPNKEIRDARLYVGYIPQNMDETRLTELFSPFGKLTEAKVIRDRTTGFGKGYGFVHFENPIDAALAVRHMNGYKVDGKMLAVRVAGVPPATASSVLGLPMYSGPSAVPSTVPSQTGLLGPPGLIAVPSTVLSQTGLLGPAGLKLRGAQVSFPRSEGAGLPMYSGPTAVPSTVPTQTGLLGPPRLMLPVAQASFLISEGSGLPMYSGPAAVPSTVPTQTGLLGPPRLMLPGAQASFPISEGSGLPMYTGPAAVPLTVLSQTGLLGPPGLMLPGAQTSFPRSEGLGLPSSSIYAGCYSYIHKSEAPDFPPPVVSSLRDSKNVSSFNSSGKQPNQIQSLDSGSLKQFPGDPDYPSSGFQSYFATPGLMLPGAEASFPKSEGVGLSPSSLYLGHCNHLPKSEVLNFTPPVVSSVTDSKGVSGFHSSYEYSNRTQSLNLGSLEKFPGDPDYRSSQSQFSFTTPTFRPPQPSHFSQSHR
ncbi:splicing factor-like protein 1 [Cornus florida]|uniref:splicing factor-like protein 1 n=1 Tax=Cornus florida TaxID=4283 RepID=UPI00289C83F8|nr:splicing factor-like protein 1 [Cornus florida]XP_059667062.1 splicing factor-like protein 1 [Cornus florida]XP_059667063.1 splicing factor-like protein 1 [Cornus florida]XP_059667064.1 splicing factor-like protein 1 [Cornus florida]XP_059667065.1 splicing factor-like protein 1 [Cornus florida]